MLTVVNTNEGSNPADDQSRSILDEIVRDGARQMLAAALRAEVAAYIDQFADQVDEALLSRHMAMAYAPDPDLFIRTGGEQRTSNFLLWQIAYSELYFCDTFWPDFNEQCLHEAIASYQKRQRRFGKTEAQVENNN